MSVRPIDTQPQGGRHHEHHHDHQEHQQEHQQQVYTTQPPSTQVNVVNIVNMSTPQMPSLQQLAQVNQMMLKREISWMKCYSGWDTNAEYEITDMAGQRLFTAKEETDWGSRYRLWGTRGFKIKVFDTSNNEVMRISRHFKAMQGMCCSCMPDVCGHEVHIQSPIQEMAGYVHQTGSCCRPSYNVLDPYDRELLNVKGPCCVFYGICAMCKQEFTVDSKTMTLSNGGMITKIWSGLCKEAFSDAKDFQIDFPPGLDVKARAGMLASAILVDFMLWYNRRAWGCAFASWAAY